MSLLSKNEIKEIDDLPSKTVEIPEWGGSIKLRMMTTKSRMDFEKKQSQVKTNEGVVVLLVLYSCVDEDGNRLFSDDDYDFLASRSPKALMTLFETATELNSLSRSGLEDKAKNS